MAPVTTGGSFSRSFLKERLTDQPRLGAASPIPVWIGIRLFQLCTMLRSRLRYEERRPETTCVSVNNFGSPSCFEGWWPNKGCQTGTSPGDCQNVFCKSLHLRLFRPLRLKPALVEGWQIPITSRAVAARESIGKATATESRCSGRAG